MAVTPAISTASRDFYQAYLNSPDWRRKRNEKLRQVGWQCERCPSRRHLNVHHKTYERLGAEWMEDLEALCADCHETHHRVELEQSSIGVYVKLARQALRDQPFASIAELSAATKDLCAKHKVQYDRHEVDRALGLLTGTRIKRIVKPHWRTPDAVPDPVHVTAQDAHEVIMRLRSRIALETVPMLGSFVKVDDAAHEATVRAQAKSLLSLPTRRRRIPVRERLEAIFANDY